MKTQTKNQQRPNYRIYDRTGGGVTHDIHADSILQARSSRAASGSRMVTGAAIETMLTITGQSEPADDGTVVLLARLNRALPLVEDEDATRDADTHDCSGQYNDDLPECVADEDGEHDWQSDYEVVGGIRENPGVWSTGGTAFHFTYCCAKCGSYKEEKYPGSQRNPGEPLETITIRERDEKSEAWLKETQRGRRMAAGVARGISRVRAHGEIIP